MNKFGKRFALVVCMLLAFSFTLTGCEFTLDFSSTPNTGDSTTDPDKTPGGDKTPDDDNEDQPGGDENPDPAEEFAVSYRTDYTPTYFKDVSYEITELAEGVNLVAHTMTLTSGAMKDKISVVQTIEIDLAKANIVAGTDGNKTTDFNWTKATPYRMALDWEAATGGQVYASINADFFGSYSVNAFVKDGIIIKDGHNDNGNYDYKNGDSDVPASAPMLFGVKGTTAQIAPMIAVEGDPATPAVKQKIVQAKLTYGLAIGETVYQLQTNTSPSSDGISYLTSGMSSQNKGYAVKVDTSKDASQVEVLEIKRLSRTERITAGTGYAWLQTTAESGAIADYFGGLKEGDTISFSVASPDGTWDGYETILGCRQALVLNNEVPATLKLENTNGAQTQDVPRTAVGVKNGKVVLFAVESLYYYASRYSYTPDPEMDFHGMNLPELAEFAYYYGCSDAANFDGGGSTQLVVRGAGEDTARTVVRAAEYFTRGLFDTRVVMNAFLVTSR